MLIYSVIPEPQLNQTPLRKVNYTNFKSHFGEPGDIELPDSGSTDEHLIICQYDEQGFSLFFQENTLATISITNHDLKLFNETVFKFKEKELIALFAANGIAQYEIDKDWGEKQLVFDTAGITFFFDNQKVSEVFIDIV